jgi:CubicO group peptidase (beta-lactamase class C family)
VPGVALAVVRNGQVVKMRGYGLADVERRVPVTADTVFEIGSITKQFTATAIMMLVEQGSIDLADPIGKYVADLPEGWNAITIRQLLTHTSGIPDYEEIMGYGGYRNPMTSAQIIALAAAKPLDFPPGTKWNYSNTGYYLLTLILEKISGEPYERFLHDHIFAPAGMTHTRTSEPNDIILNRAAGYEYKGGHLENRDAMQPTATGGAGMIVSTVGDLAKWNAILDRQSMLHKDSYAQIWADALLANGKPSGYGFGWFVSPRRNHPSERHGGGTAGFTADFWRLPNDRLAIIVLGNLYSSFAVAQISAHIANALVPDLRYRAVPHDPNPATAKRVLDFYAHRLDSDVYATPLSPRFATEIKGRWSGSFDYFRTLGAPYSVELVELPPDAGAGSYRYRIRYRDVSRIVLFRIGEDSLIDDILDAEEE